MKQEEFEGGSSRSRGKRITDVRITQGHGSGPGGTVAPRTRQRGEKEGLWASSP